MNLLDVLFPKRCVNCGKIGKYFCVNCRKKIRQIADNERICPMCGRLAFGGVTHPQCRTRYGIDGLTSFFHYSGPVQKAIKAIKYRGVSDLAKEFVGLVKADSRLRGNDILIPIPLHPSRLRDRGFNQAEILARQLHRPLRTDILARTKATSPQAEIKKQEDRLANMQHVFESKNVSGTIVLFDDVFTTGATMRSAANVLKRAGASRVWAVTIAR